MNLKLALLCLRLWALGFLGMGVARWVLGRGPGSVGFDLCALACAVGGVTYVVLGLVYVAGTREEDEEPLASLLVPRRSSGDAGEHESL